MTQIISNLRYRPEIDGLRALAVLGVVFYHAGLGVSGGYVGVDVFFVISGFLITSLIIKELESRQFTLANFWERRARRIIPAMVVVVSATLVAGWFLLLPSDYITLGRSAAWQAVFGANINFWRHTGYFEGNAREQPLLHTWSLAVEEQFYVVVPLLLLALFRVPRFRNRKNMLLLFSVLIASSLAASIWGVAHHPVAAFYLLPTRAWELLCGAFVALVPGGWLLKSRLSREAFSLLGFTGILVPFWFYTKSTPFPGLAAVAPCFGTAMFIWASSIGQCPTYTGLPTVARFLSLRPIVFIGLISYSFYLWHWPFFAFSAYWALEPRSSIFNLTLVGVSFLLAALTWRYIETPFRKRIVCPIRPAMFVFGVASIAAILLLGVVLIRGNGFPSRLPTKAIEYANATNKIGGIHELTAADIMGDRLIPLGSPALPTQPRNFLLWGDSHAMAAAPAFDQFLKGRGLAGLQATASGTAPILGAYWQNGATNRNEAIAFNTAVFNYIKQHQIANVVLIGRWEYYTDERGNTALDSGLLSTVKKLVQAGVRPWVMLQVPSYYFNVPRALAITSIFDLNLTPLLTAPVGWNGLRGDGDIILKRIEAAGGNILDPRPFFMDGSRSHFLVEKNGISLYADDNHLSMTGAKMVLAPFFEESLHLEEIQDGSSLVRINAQDNMINLERK